jgi:mitochondrial cardiolipin hydrolase
VTFLAAVLLTQDVDVRFSPGLQDRISAELREARKTVDVAMFHFTSERLARALAERSRAGLRVRVLLDASQADPDFVRRLKAGGIDVRLATPKEEGARFHHKFAVLDDGLAITGSYNWTYRGDAASHENLVILRDARSAGRFQAEFERLWTDPELSRP